MSESSNSKPDPVPVTPAPEAAAAAVAASAAQPPPQQHQPQPHRPSNGAAPPAAAAAAQPAQPQPARRQSKLRALISRGGGGGAKKQPKKKSTGAAAAASAARGDRPGIATQGSSRLQLEHQAVMKRIEATAVRARHEIDGIRRESLQKEAAIRAEIERLVKEIASIEAEEAVKIKAVRDKEALQLEKLVKELKKI